jgi:hypothetical protein
MRLKHYHFVLVAILFTILSCKKSPQYPPNTITVQYVITSTAPFPPNSFFSYTAPDTIAKRIDNPSGSLWTTTVIISTEKGNRFPGNKLFTIALNGSFNFTSQNTVEGKIYVNGNLVNDQVVPAVNSVPPGTYASGLFMQWETQASNPL